jgi:hypothetical protein
MKKTLPNGFGRRPSICLRKARFPSLRERCASGHMKSRAEGQRHSNDEHAKFVDKVLLPTPPFIFIIETLMAIVVLLIPVKLNAYTIIILYEP